jgi:hypothetical protein
MTCVPLASPATVRALSRTFCSHGPQARGEAAEAAAAGRDTAVRSLSEQDLCDLLDRQRLTLKLSLDLGESPNLSLVALPERV